MTQQLAPEEPITSHLALVAILATAAAAIVNSVLVFVLTSIWQLAVIFSSGVMLETPLLNWLWGGAILAAPVTLILLPTATIVGQRYPVALYVLPLPLIGFVSAVLVAKLWAILLTTNPALVSFAKAHLSFEAPALVGIFPIFPSALAGLVAGIIFSVATRKMRR